MQRVRRYGVRVYITLKGMNLPEMSLQYMNLGISLKILVDASQRQKYSMANGMWRNDMADYINIISAIVVYGIILALVIAVSMLLIKVALDKHREEIARMKGQEPISFISIYNSKGEQVNLDNRVKEVGRELRRHTAQK
jgi:hypothetical protein